MEVVAIAAVAEAPGAAAAIVLQVVVPGAVAAAAVQWAEEAMAVAAVDQWAEVAAGGDNPVTFAIKNKEAVSQLSGAAF